jgi:invasion protein IalB
MVVRHPTGDLKMRTTILAALAALALSAVAFGADKPAAQPATAPAAAQAPAKPDAKAADCEKQAKAKGLKDAAAKKFVADCVKPAAK